MAAEYNILSPSLYPWLTNVIVESDVDTSLELTYFGSTIVFLAIVSYSIVLLTNVSGAISTVIWSLVLSSWPSDVCTRTSYLSRDPICSSLVVSSVWSSLLPLTIVTI